MVIKKSSDQKHAYPPLLLLLMSTNVKNQLSILIDRVVWHHFLLYIVILHKLFLFHFLNNCSHHCHIYCNVISSVVTTNKSLFFLKFDILFE